MAEEQVIIHRRGVIIRDRRHRVVSGRSHLCGVDEVWRDDSPELLWRVALALYYNIG